MRSTPTFTDLFQPKLVTALREGYGLTTFRADALAGLTVAIVALPLSMAIAIASGATPAVGLFTAIVGGFLVSALGGSRYQVGGPAGAFIVLVAAVIARQGFDGLVIATGMAGLILVAAGFLRFGTYIKFIPHPVVVGFTSAIALIIFASQIRDLLGLTLSAPEPAELLHKVQALWAARDSVSPAAVAMSAAVIATIFGLRRFAPRLPGLLVAVVGAAFATWALGLPIETIGTRFGELPRVLPAPHLPVVSMDRLIALAPDALSIAFLGGIESLLSAMVADGMTGRRHRANCELVAQGVANMATALFGGMPVTGTIARTATNIRGGAMTPVAGMLHAVFLLIFMFVAAPLASFIPLAALAGVLAVVAWNMAERDLFSAIVRRGGGEALVLLATFLLTILVDLMVGIAVGVVLGSLVFMHRMAALAEVSAATGLDGSGDQRDTLRQPDAPGADPDRLVLRLSGPLFFGSVSTIAAALDRIGRTPDMVVLDLTDVPLLDGSAALGLRVFAERTLAAGSQLRIVGARAQVRHLLSEEGITADCFA